MPTATHHPNLLPARCHTNHLAVNSTRSFFAGFLNLTARRTTLSLYASCQTLKKENDKHTRAQHTCSSPALVVQRPPTLPSIPLYDQGLFASNQLHRVIHYHHYRRKSLHTHKKREKTQTRGKIEAKQRRREILTHTQKKINKLNPYPNALTFSTIDSLVRSRLVRK